MIHDFCDWLPLEALTDQVVLTECVQIGEAWSDRWSARRTEVLYNLVSLSLGIPSVNSALRLGQLVQIDWSDKLAISLACWALDIREVPATISESDRVVLKATGEDIALDLTTMLAQGFNIPAQPQPAPERASSDRIALDLAIPDRDTNLRVLLPVHYLARFRKSRCKAPPRLRRSSVSFPTSALPETAVDLDVVLGKTALSLRDLRSIEIGDVIRLDQRLNSPIVISKCGETGAVLGSWFRPNGAGALLTLCSSDAVIPR